MELGKGLGDRLGDCFDPIRFFQIGSRTHGDCFANQIGPGKPTGDDNALLCVKLQNTMVGFQAVDSRIHDHVEKHKVGGMRLKVGDRFLATGNTLYRIAQFFENAGRDLTLIRNIIHDEHALAASSVVFRPMVGGGIGGGVCCRWKI